MLRCWGCPYIFVTPCESNRCTRPGSNSMSVGTYAIDSDCKLSDRIYTDNACWFAGWCTFTEEYGCGQECEKFVPLKKRHSESLEMNGKKTPPLS